jgi:hypothetical protein
LMIEIVLFLQISTYFIGVPFAAVCLYYQITHA